MHYTRKITDQQTGEVFKISLGEHLTFTEVAIKLKIKRASLIKILINMQICQKEFDPKAKEYRYRLKPEAVEKGIGFRIYGENGPFDVLSPMALDWINQELIEQLQATKMTRETIDALQSLHEFNDQRSEKLDMEGKVRWLLDYFPALPILEIGKGLGICRSLVHRYQTRKREQLARWQKKRAALPENKLVWTDDALLSLPPEAA